MANVPILDYQVYYPSGVVGRVSFIPPYNQVNIQIKCNQHIKTFRCRTTYQNEERGKDKGYLVTEMTNRPADTYIPFTLTANSALTQGDGTYKVSLYVQNDEDIWNEYVLFLTTESGGEHLKVKDADGNYFNVKEA